MGRRKNRYEKKVKFSRETLIQQKKSKKRKKRRYRNSKTRFTKKKKRSSNFLPLMLNQITPNDINDWTKSRSNSCPRRPKRRIQIKSKRSRESIGHAWYSANCSSEDIFSGSNSDFSIISKTPSLPKLCKIVKARRKYIAPIKKRVYVKKE